MSRLRGAYARRMARWLGRRPFVMPATDALITFTFDDFPRSALLIGGAILEHLGAAGTYFVAMGLQGQTIATGEMFTPDDLGQIASREQHELGCHTFHHHPAWETPSGEYLSSVLRNADALAALPASSRSATHSYPISYPRPVTKRALARRFRSCRGGGQTFNRGTVDLNYLSSFFLEQSVGNFGAIERVIAQTVEQRGWLIFSTHDISDSPTPFGCSPEFFEQTVRCAVKSGARLQTMSSALDALGIPPLPPETSPIGS